MTKIDKISEEIYKVKAKISDFQSRLRELENQKLQEENSEIIGVVRGGNISYDELAAIVEAFRTNKVGLIKTKGKEDIQNES